MNRIGMLGESIAEKYLQTKGFTILERNYRKKFGEVDVIAKKGEKIHFVEVKTISREKRSLTIEYRPEELVDDRKLEKIRKVAEFYMFSREIVLDPQIDVIAVYVSEREKRAQVKYIENV